MKTKTNAFQSCLLVVLSLFLISVSLAGVPAMAKTQVNLNTATEQELATLPGIGAPTAQNIIAARPFKKVGELQKVNGIGKAKYNAIKHLVTVEAAADPKTAKQATPADPVGATAGAKSAKTATQANKQAMAAGPVDINSADQKTLETLPGIGAATAKRIIAARPFQNVEDLQKVRGVGKAKYESLKDKVTIGAAGSAGPATTTTETKPAVASEKAGAKTTQPSGHEVKKAMPSGPVDINTADLKTLEALPGIGPVKAQAIIDHRPYTKVEDIMKVPGIKRGTFARIKDHIVVK